MRPAERGPQAAGKTCKRQSLIRAARNGDDLIIGGGAGASSRVLSLTAIAGHQAAVDGVVDAVRHELDGTVGEAKVETVWMVAPRPRMVGIQRRLVGSGGDFF